MTTTQKQCLLTYLGYDTGGVDGDWGKASRAGCEAFQNDYGLTADGICGPVTDKALIGAVAGTVVPVRKPQSGQEASDGPEWWKDIQYFTRAEFKCKCGGKYCNGYPAEPDERMVRIADQLRKNLGVPITIISGLRCNVWNAIQGGVSNSQHVYGEAADVYAKGVSQSRVEAELDKIGGVRYHYPIKNSSNVHFDVPKGSR